uniref:Uncharacterized protein n=1 Tax=Macrostomum lignano TaxID=282301 RepID=A0A1I8FE47_9PLAT
MRCEHQVLRVLKHPGRYWD